jgi:hypothetical protein
VMNVALVGLMSHEIQAIRRTADISSDSESVSALLAAARNRVVSAANQGTP